MSDALSSSVALWNRSHVDLRSSETLAQIMDRGELSAWRELYRLCKADADLRGRALAVVKRVPLAYAHFWLAALATIDPDIDLASRLPSCEDYAGGT
jgi:hypothetical protein